MNWIIVRLVDRFIGIPLLWFLRIFFWPKRYCPPKKISRILLVKFWGAGNIMMLLPGLKAIKENYASAQVDFLTLTSNEKILANTQMCASLILIDVKSLSAFVKSIFTSMHKLRSMHYDIVIDFEQFARFSALMVGFTRSPVKIGLVTRGQHRHCLYNVRIPYNNHIHIIDIFMSLFRYAFNDNRFKLCQCVDCFHFDFDSTKKKISDKGFLFNKPIVIMHVGTSPNFYLRRWPKECFAKLAIKLRDTYGVAIFFTGITGEIPISAGIMTLIENKKDIYDCVGYLSVVEFISLVKIAGLVISADTAPVHIASALSIPVVAMYGPNTPDLYGPWGGKSLVFYKKLPCSPCITNYNAKMNICRHPKGRGYCMRSISAEEVFDAIKGDIYISSWLKSIGNSK